MPEPDKPQKFQLRIERRLLARAKRRAAEEGVTLAEQIRLLVRDWISQGTRQRGRM